MEAEAADPPVAGAFSRAEALEHLRRAVVGRIGFVADDQPYVLPVNVAVDEEGRIAFRTSEGGVLAGVNGRRVALEVDGYDTSAATGWYVIVTGVAWTITHAIDVVSEHLRSLPVVPWAPPPRTRWMAVFPDSISGRRVALGDGAGWFPGVPS